MIVIDGNFISILKNYYVNEMEYIEASTDILIYTINQTQTNNNYGVSANSKTEEYLIKLLRYQKSAKSKGLSGQRGCIPAITKYNALTVNRIPFGISRCFHNSYNIISPITKIDSNINVDKDVFIKNITQRDDYKKLVIHVLENQIGKKPITEIDINDLYEQLIGEYYDLIKITLP